MNLLNYKTSSSLPYTHDLELGLWDSPTAFIQQIQPPTLHRKSDPGRCCEPSGGAQDLVGLSPE